MNPLRFIAITVLTVSEIQVYSAIISETQRQHSWLQRGRTAAAGAGLIQDSCSIGMRKCTVISSDGTWAEQDSLFHSQISGRLHWRGCWGEVILAGFLRNRIKDGISTYPITFKRLCSWCIT